MGKGKRGRPKSVGVTKTVRVPKDLYLLIQWIADARRMDSSEVVKNYLRMPLIRLFLSLQDEVKQGKSAEDAKAKIQGTTPLPLPRIRIRLPPKYRPTPKNDPSKSGRENRAARRAAKEVWADEIDRELLETLLNYKQFDPSEYDFEELYDDSPDWVRFNIVYEEPTPPEKPAGQNDGDLTELP